MNLKPIYVFGICVVFMFGMKAESVKAQALSTDELLEYSLASLQKTMDAAVKENQKLSSKNSSIRKRLLFLKKELRELGDQLMQAKEGAVDVKNGIKLDAKELKIEEKRLNNALERKRQLEFERDIIKKQIETLVFEREAHQDEYETVQLDLKELKAEVGGPISSNLLDYFAEEKLKLLDMIKERRARIDQIKDKIDRYELKSTDELRNQEVALRQQESLEHELSSWELRWKEEKAHEDLLKRSLERWRGVAKEHRQAAEGQNSSRKEYIRSLKKVIEDFGYGQRKIADQVDYETVEMERYLSLLKEKNDILFQYQKVLEEQDRLVEAKQAQEHTALLLQDQKQEIDEKWRHLESEVAELKNDIAQQRKLQDSLKQEEQRAQKELRDLAVRVDKVKRSVTTVRKDAFGKKLAEMDKAIKEQKDRLDDLNSEKQKLLAKSAREEQRFQKFYAAQEKLRAEQAQLKSALKEFDVSKEDLTKQQKEFKALGEEQVAVFKAEMQAAQMKKKALQASVEVVHKKYNVEEGAAQEFESEQEELAHYLKVLKEENISLQRKLSNLTQQK